jgi:hypothetical protein
MHDTVVVAGVEVGVDISKILIALLDWMVAF